MELGTSRISETVSIPNLLSNPQHKSIYIQLHTNFQYKIPIKVNTGSSLPLSVLFRPWSSGFVAVAVAAVLPQLRLPLPRRSSTRYHRKRNTGIATRRTKQQIFTTK
jgi:hypothetical protein